jgi:hypothetical protein
MHLQALLLCLLFKKKFDKQYIIFKFDDSTVVIHVIVLYCIEYINNVLVFPAAPIAFIFIIAWSCIDSSKQTFAIVANIVFLEVRRICLIFTIFLPRQT